MEFAFFFVQLAFASVAGMFGGVFCRAFACDSAKSVCLLDLWNLDHLSAIVSSLLKAHVEIIFE